MERTPSKAGVLRTPLPMPFSIRGWLRARRWRATLREAGLPRELEELTASVVRRTRLWTAEQADVCRELVGHFRDGLAAGATPGDLARNFGDPRASARLIRRAKVRLRPWWYQAFRRGSEAAVVLVALLVVVYVVQFVRFATAKPTIARNFTQELNAPIATTSEAERAWPLYLEALRLSDKPPKALTQGPDADWPSRPGSPRWPDAVAYVESVRPAVDTLVQAASRPTLGYELSNTVPKDLAQALRDAKIRAGENVDASQPVLADPPAENPELIGVLMPYLAEFRAFARLLVADARLAVEQRDPDRFVRNVRAMHGVARHAAQPPFLIGSLVQIAIFTLASETVLDALPSGVLAERHLRELAHLTASFSDSQLDMDFRVERMMTLDALQRVYSDDGRGDGRLSAQGLRTLHAWSRMYSNEPDELSGVGLYALGPVAGTLIASRAEQLAKYDELLAAVERDADTPPWLRGSVYESDRVRDSVNSTPMRKTRYIFVSTLASAFGQTIDARDAAIMRRDAVQTALALEAFRLRAGRYPTTLDELVPAFLPAPPIDVCSGRPLRYRVDAGGPVLYSVGRDRTDDGGIFAASESLNALAEQIRPWAEGETDAIGRPVPKPAPADWILYAPGLKAPTRAAARS